VRNKEQLEARVIGVLIALAVVFVIMALAWLLNSCITVTVNTGPGRVSDDDRTGSSIYRETPNASKERSTTPPDGRH
jgi:hypothetical protein